MGSESVMLSGMTEEPDGETKERVAARFRARREELGLKQHDLKSRGGPSAGPVARFEGSKHEWPKTSALRTGWALALDWEPDAWDRVVTGDEPRERVRRSTAVGDEVTDLLEKIEHDLAQLRRRLQP